MYPGNLSGVCLVMAISWKKKTVLGFRGCCRFLCIHMPDTFCLFIVYQKSLRKSFEGVAFVCRISAAFYLKAVEIGDEM